MLLCEAYTFRQIEQAIQPLRRENARGAHIFVRPHGAHTLNLVDDLGVDAIARMTDAGFQPALVVETSPQNFQVWLNHRRTLDRNMSTWAAKELAKRFGGDLSSADWRHFGRLAGFTNQKPKRRLRNGLSPYVRLHQCEGRTYTAAYKFLQEVKSLAHKASARSSARRYLERLRPKTRSDPSLSFTAIRGTAAICIALTWRGLYTQRAATLEKNKSGTKYSTPATYQKKAAFIDSSTTRDEPRSRRSAPSSRSIERRFRYGRRKRGAILKLHPKESAFSAHVFYRICEFGSSFIVVDDSCQAKGGSRQALLVQIPLHIPPCSTRRAPLRRQTTAW